MNVVNHLYSVDEGFAAELSWMPNSPKYSCPIPWVCIYQKYLIPYSLHIIGESRVAEPCTD